MKSECGWLSSLAAPQIPFTISGAGLGGSECCQLGVPDVEASLPNPV